MPVLCPPSLTAALDALAADPSAVVLAGGTDLMVAAHEGHVPLQSVVAIGQLPELRSWSHDAAAGILRIGAAITAAELAASDLAVAAPALAAAGRALGSVPVRNAATVGGSLGTSSPAADLVTALVALDAVVEIRSVSGLRRVPVTEVIRGPHENALIPGELIVAVEVPAADGPQDFAKIGGRASVSVAVVNLALVVRRKAGRVRVGAGAVGPAVVCSADADDLLSGSVDWEHLRWAAGVDRDTVCSEVGLRLAAASDPVDDARATAAYRRHALAVLVGRLARRCLG